MITGYFRPNTLQEAYKLLENPQNKPVGGGTTLSSLNRDISVVDLQNLGLDTIIEKQARYVIGARVNLESFLTFFRNSSAIENAIKIEASRNQREQSTLAGLICAGNGRSPLLTLLLAMDISMKWQPGDIEIQMGEYLSQRKNWNQATLITEIAFDKSTQYCFESIGRSPYDQPIICLALSRWASNRLRITAGGFGDLPILVMDGNMNDNIELAVENALLAATDEWASAEYRIAAAKKIVGRLMNELK